MEIAGARPPRSSRFLDDVVEVNRFPNAEIEMATRETRKIGLWVMGLAELLASQEIAYDSEDAVRLGDRIAQTVREEATRTSAELAEQRRPFTLFGESVLATRSSAPLRNAEVTSIAPTGTISVIAGTTSGIGPMFARASTLRSRPADRPGAGGLPATHGDRSSHTEPGWTNSSTRRCPSS